MTDNERVLGTHSKTPWEVVASLTLRPTSLLCRFIKGWAFRGFFRLLRPSRASTKLREKVIPKSTLSEHPDHWKLVNDSLAIRSFFGETWQSFFDYGYCYCYLPGILRVKFRGGSDRIRNFPGPRWSMRGSKRALRPR